MKKRRIIHVDLDAFFASVEQVDHPEWKNKPVIVGGVSQRGVVATCSYEARRFGVHSAQPGFEAKKKCPHGIFVHGRHSRYQEVSRQVFKIIRSVCEKVEVVSIDEAYLDVTALYYSPVYIANYIKKKVKEETGLTLSVGISYNKFLAKLASDWEKPDGIKIIKKEEVPDILRPLSIKKVHGLGDKSVKKLNRIGVYTIDDLLGYDTDFFDDFFGKFGKEIYERIRGVDHRPVDSSQSMPKSIGTETTLSEDAHNYFQVEKYLELFSTQISDRLSNKGLVATTLSVKLKTSDFENHTKSKTASIPFYKAEDIYRMAHDLLKAYDFNKSIRLIGISVSNLKDKSYEQLSIFSDM